MRQSRKRRAPAVTAVTKKRSRIFSTVSAARHPLANLSDEVCDRSERSVIDPRADRLSQRIPSGVDKKLTETNRREMAGSANLPWRYLSRGDGRSSQLRPRASRVSIWRL